MPEASAIRSIRYSAANFHMTHKLPEPDFATALRVKENVSRYGKGCMDDHPGGFYKREV
jgi:hypothetical protein